MHESPDIRRFLKAHWEKMLLWAVLIGLFYLLKPFFLLIFETFLITYTARGCSLWAGRRLGLSYRLSVTAVFLLVVGLLTVAGTWVGPRLAIESRQFVVELAGDGGPQAGERASRFVESIVARLVGEAEARAMVRSERYAAAMEAMEAEAGRLLKQGLPRVIDAVLQVARFGWEILVSLLLAIVLSFILVLDWERIAAGVRVLERSRIRTFYQGAAPHLQAFADVLGKAFLAQAIIAACNTALTALGLWAFGVPSVALLATVVFVCGFVPIVGTFLSSVPILLFAAQAGGLLLVLKMVAFIAGIHALEAYVLNPKITADVLRVHPILVLVFLLVGERFLGLWGMVLGVPVGCYVITVLAQPDPALAATAHVAPPTGSPH